MAQCVWLSPALRDDSCEKYVEVACDLADHLGVTALAIDETSRAGGHVYVTLAADADARRVVFATEGGDAKTI